MNNYYQASLFYGLLTNVEEIANVKGINKNGLVYQLTLGKKKERISFCLEYRNNQAWLKQGFADTKPSVRLHFSSIKKLKKYCLDLKGQPLVAGFYNPIQVFSFASFLKNTTKAYHDKNDKLSHEIIIRVKLRSLFNTIHELRKAGNPIISKWANEASRTNYLLEVDGIDDSKIWLTVQEGRSKVLDRQSSILTSHASLSFADLEELSAFFSKDHDFRNSYIDEKLLINQDYLDPDKERANYKTIIEEAFRYLS